MCITDKLSFNDNKWDLNISLEKKGEYEIDSK